MKIKLLSLALVAFSMISSAFAEENAEFKNDCKQNSYGQFFTLDGQACGPQPDYVLNVYGQVYYSQNPFNNVAKIFYPIGGSCIYLTKYGLNTIMLSVGGTYVCIDASAGGAYTCAPGTYCYAPQLNPTFNCIPGYNCGVYYNQQPQ